MSPMATAPELATSAALQGHGHGDGRGEVEGGNFVFALSLRHKLQSVNNL